MSSGILRPEDISEDDLKVPSRVLYRVLLVHRTHDENAVVLHHLENSSCNEFDFSSVSSTSAALAKLKESSFDLVVLALDLPDGQELDGFESLKKAFPDIAIVILSTTKNRDLAISAVKRGAHDFLITNATYPVELVKLRLLYSIERSRTERTAKSLARTEKFALRSVVENAPLMFMRLDSSYVMRDCNKNFADVLQQPRTQIRRRLLFDLIPEFTVDEIEQLSTGDQLLRKRVFIFDRQTESQNEAFWNCFGWPFFKTNSEEKESIIVAIDVTREALLDQFREEFLAAVAHDIKNPVVGQERILSALLKSHKDLPPDVVSSLTTLRNSGLQLINLLSTLVDIYRHDFGEITVSVEGTSLNESIEQQYEELQCIAVSSERSVVLELGVDLPCAAIDSTSAYRLVANLIHNALQNAAKNSEILVKTYDDEDSIFLEVNNQGHPIKAAQLSKLFQRFSRTSNGAVRANSSGLGLYLCKQTVEKCGGTIMCISDATSGTTFVIKLPKAES